MPVQQKSNANGMRVIVCALAVSLAAATASAIQVTRPYGDPSLNERWKLIVWMRQSQPELEATSYGTGSIPQVSATLNYQTQNLGLIRAFYGGTLFDGEWLYQTTTTGQQSDKVGYFAGLGGYYSPKLLPDERFEDGKRVNDESMEFSRYGFRALLVEKGSWYETALFVTFGNESYDKTSRTSTDFVLPSDTSLMQYGISYVWDRRKRKVNSSRSKYAPEDGGFGYMLATYTTRSRWREWGADGNQFDDSGQKRDWRAAIALGNVATQEKTQSATVYLRGGFGGNLDRLSAFRIGGGTDYDRNPYRFRAHGYFFNEFLCDSFYGYNVDVHKQVSNSIVAYLAYDHAFANVFNGETFSSKTTQIRGVGGGIEYFGLFGGNLRVTYGYGMDADREDTDSKNHEMIVAYEHYF